jgi:hypothetical protein
MKGYATRSTDGSTVRLIVLPNAATPTKEWDGERLEDALSFDLTFAEAHCLISQLEAAVRAVPSQNGEKA